MRLGELIKALEAVDDLTVELPLGFSSPHSYRGFYDELAFEPTANVTIRSMLDAAREALGSTFIGYKGGEFTMHDYTRVHLAEYGREGETIGSILLGFMLAQELAQ